MKLETTIELVESLADEFGMVDEHRPSPASRGHCSLKCRPCFCAEMVGRIRAAVHADGLQDTRTSWLQNNHSGRPRSRAPMQPSIDPDPRRRRPLPHATFEN